MEEGGLFDIINNVGSVEKVAILFVRVYDEAVVDCIGESLDIWKIVRKIGYSSIVIATLTTR